MRSVALFVAGILVGSAIQVTRAQPPRGGLALNHVAISVPDLDEGIRFYTRALGLKEAFTFRDNRGSPLSYLQISRDTFLELQQATADRPPGLIHIGLEVGDLRTAIVRFRQGGLEVGDPSESQRTKAVISQAAGPNGLRFELLEFGPDSLQRKVINAWK
jgi:catechol 2,3-dioxygenase-like lactoylglutathione lyase family enzyme